MSREIREILVVPAATGEQEVAAKGGGWMSQKIIEPVRLNADTLGRNLADFVTSLNDALSALPPLVQGFRLEEIDVVVEVSGEGSVQMIGGLELGATGGITLKLKR